MDLKELLKVAAGGGIATLNISVCELAERALARIVELEESKTLLERGSREAVLALAQQRGTINALKERCRKYARVSD